MARPLLPYDVIWHLFLYLDYNEKLEFTRVNQEINREFMKKVREIFVRKEIRLFLQEDTVRQRYAALVHNASQLKLVFNVSFQLQLVDLVVASGIITLHKVITNITEFLTMCRNNEFQVHTLAMSKSLGEDLNGQVLIAQLTDRLNEWREGVKELDFYDYEFSHLPRPFPHQLQVLCIQRNISLTEEGLLIQHHPSLERLHLNECPSIASVNSFSSLHYLQLFNCNGITDVSPLSNVHSLQLILCHGISDVSRLQNNYLIHIRNCKNIKRFNCIHQNWRKIQLFFFSLKVAHLPIALEYFVSAHEVIISGDWPIKFQGTWPASLRSFKIERNQSITALSPNRLRRIEIIHCPRFSSLQNMEHAKYIKLEHLNLRSLAELEAVSNPNRTIEILGCDSIVDFSCLKGTAKQVKLTHSFDQVDVNVTSFEGVTHLVLPSIVSKFTEFAAIISTLKVLELGPILTSCDERILCDLLALSNSAFSHIETIVIRGLWILNSQFQASYQKELEALRQEFDFEASSIYRKVFLLRKNQVKSKR